MIDTDRPMFARSRFKHAQPAGRESSGRSARALKKAGFWVERQGKHVVMTDGERTVTIPRHNPVNAVTMGNVIRDAGLTIDEFRKLL